MSFHDPVRISRRFEKLRILTWPSIGKSVVLWLLGSLCHSRVSDLIPELPSLQHRTFESS